MCQAEPIFRPPDPHSDAYGVINMDYNFLTLIAGATLTVKFIMGLLLLMSLSSWAIIFGKWISLSSADRKARAGSERFERARDLREAVQSLGGDPSSPLYAVAQHGVLEFNRSKEAGAGEAVVVDNVRRALSQGVGQEMSRLNASLAFLCHRGQRRPLHRSFRYRLGHHALLSRHRTHEIASLATVAPAFPKRSSPRPSAFAWLFPPPCPTTSFSESSAA